MSSADFYVGIGSEAEWIGTVGADGSTADMDDAGLFGPAPGDDDYTEGTFRAIVHRYVAELADGSDEEGYLASRGHPWPWKGLSESRAGMIYCYNKGSIHVFERTDGGADGKPGHYLVALHYPNGTRKPTVFAREGGK